MSYRIPKLGDDGKVAAEHIPDPAAIGAATPADLSSGLATKVNTSTYTAGLAGKQDTASLAADVAAHVADGSALATALGAALGSVYVVAADTTGATDATAAIQAQIDAATANAQGGRVYIPAGLYKLSSPLVPKNKVHIQGAGQNLTRLLPYGTAAAIQYLGSTSAPLLDWHMSDLTIDGTNQAGTYATSIKGTYITFLQRCSIRRVRITQTGATGLGNDHHLDCVYDSVIAENCGRLNDGTQGGGAGIGIGTGGWLANTEALSVVNCVTRNNKRCGLFFETQNGGMPEGTRVIGHYSENNGEHGIADAGLTGLVVSGGQSRANGGAGFACYAGTINPGAPGRAGLVTGMILESNTVAGFYFDATIRETSNARYTIRGCRLRDNTGHGALIAAGATTDVNGIAVESCEIHGNQKGGIVLTSAGATVTDLAFMDNRIFNNGLNTGAAERQGIRVACSTNRLRVAGNKAWDAQGTKTQTYGLQLNGGTTVTGAVIDGNDFQNNLTGAVNVSATLGATNIVGPNAGWTVAAGAPEGVVFAPVGTVYRRTDGGASTTLYVKESGTVATGWVAK